MLLPLAHQRLAGRGRDDHHVGLALHALERLADERERRDVLHDLADRSVDRLAPLQRQGQVGIARRRDLRRQGRVREPRLPPDPVAQARQGRDVRTPAQDLGPLGQQVHRQDQARESIDAPMLASTD